MQPREFLWFLCMVSSVAFILGGGFDRPSISLRSFGTVSGLRAVSGQLYPWFTSLVFTWALLRLLQV